MKVKMCVSNLDLFTAIGEEESMIRHLLSRESETWEKVEYELEEVHCLGFCHWCCQGPTALLDGKFVHEPMPKEN